LASLFREPLSGLRRLSQVETEKVETHLQPCFFVHGSAGISLESRPTHGIMISEESDVNGKVPATRAGREDLRCRFGRGLLRVCRCAVIQRVRGSLQDVLTTRGQQGVRDLVAATRRRNEFALDAN